ASPDPIQHLAPGAALSMDRLEPPGNASIRVALHQEMIIASGNAAEGNLTAGRSRSKTVDRRSDLIWADHHGPVRAIATDDPAIPADGTALRGRAVSTDPNGNARALHRQRRQCHPSDDVVPSPVVDTLTRQQCSDEVEGLVQSLCANTWVIWFAERGELQWDATQTGTQNHPATAELVEAGHGVREHLRAAAGQRGDSGSDAQLRGRLGNSGQGHP